ncbi:MAG: VCBS repeat-containing protein [Planctomycetota bacterium]
MKPSRPLLLALISSALLAPTAATQAPLFGELHPKLPASPFPLSFTSAVAVADVDLDADVDVVFATQECPHRLLLNDGTGVFFEGAIVTAGSSAASDLAFGDLDGDGDPDLAMANSADFSFYKPFPDLIYLNEPTGAFPPPSVVPGDDGWASFAVDLVDVDADGDLDLLRRTFLHLNDGAAGFTDVSATHLPVISGGVYALAHGDVDGDGDPDVVLGLADVTPNRLLLNDGVGVFSDAPLGSLPALADSTFGLAFADVDGDGDLDLAAANSPANRLHLGDGSGGFVDVSASHLPANDAPSLDLALADVDRDGDLDLAVANWLEQPRLYRNGGDGVFADGTTLHLPDASLPSYQVALADLDEDGDPDLLFANYLGFPNTLWTNLSRQLAWRETPTIGQPLELDLYGTPRGPWFLGWSLGQARISLPPFGTLLIDPLTSTSAGTGTLGADGRATVGFAVPSNPALVGFTLHWQALLGDPLLLSNRERTTFEGR